MSASSTTTPPVTPSTTTTSSLLHCQGRQNVQDAQSPSQNNNNTNFRALGTEFLKAAQNRNLPLMEELIHDKKVPVDFQDEFGCTALMVVTMTAFTKASIDVCRFLLNNGADIHATCYQNQQTALHYGAVSGSLDAVKFLVKSGASVLAHDVEGLTPRQLAQQYSCDATPSHQKVMEYLEELENKEQQQQEHQEPNSSASRVWKSPSTMNANQNNNTNSNNNNLPSLSNPPTPPTATLSASNSNNNNKLQNLNQKEDESSKGGGVGVNSFSVNTRSNPISPDPPQILATGATTSLRFDFSSNSANNNTAVPRPPFFGHEFSTNSIGGASGDDFGQKNPILIPSTPPPATIGGSSTSVVSPSSTSSPGYGVNDHSSKSIYFSPPLPSTSPSSAFTVVVSPQRDEDAVLSSPNTVASSVTTLFSKNKNNNNHSHHQQSSPKSKSLNNKNKFVVDEQEIQVVFPHQQEHGENENQLVSPEDEKVNGVVTSFDEKKYLEQQDEIRAKLLFPRGKKVETNSVDNSSGRNGNNPIDDGEEHHDDEYVLPCPMETAKEIKEKRSQQRNKITKYLLYGTVAGVVSYGLYIRYICKNSWNGNSSYGKFSRQSGSNNNNSNNRTFSETLLDCVAVANNEISNMYWNVKNSLGELWSSACATAVIVGGVNTNASAVNSTTAAATTSVNSNSASESSTKNTLNTKSVAKIMTEWNLA